MPSTCPCLSRDVCLVMQRCRTRVQISIWVWTDSSSFFWRFDPSRSIQLPYEPRVDLNLSLLLWKYNSIVPNIQSHLFEMDHFNSCSSGVILWIIMMQLSWLCGVLSMVSSFRESEVKQCWAQLVHAWVTILLKKLLSNDIWCWTLQYSESIYLFIRITVTFHNSECRASLHCTNLTYTSRIEYSLLQFMLFLSTFVRPHQARFSDESWVTHSLLGAMRITMFTST